MIITLIKYLIAYFRLNKRIVCEMSQNSRWDFHDYKDSKDKQPYHMMKIRCERCSKGFFL